MGIELTADAPEVDRLRTAVAVMNDAEAALIADLRGSEPEQAGELCRAVAAARIEFAAALDAVNAPRRRA